MPIRKNASMKTYINDFRKSDAPQFQGKSEDKRDEMAVAAKLQAMDKKMEEGINKYQPLFDDLYTKYEEFLNKYRIHSGNELMHKFKDPKVGMYSLLTANFDILPGHKAQLDDFMQSIKKDEQLTEKKGTLCGRCGHVHVKGTPCPRPFKEEVKPDYLDFDRDGNKTEPMKSAVKDSKLKKEVVANILGKLKEVTKIPTNNPAKPDSTDISKAKQLSARDEEFEFVKRGQALAEGLERDYEGEMAKSQLISIVKNAKELFDMIDNSTQLEGWVQSKLTKAEDYLSAVASYLEGQSITSTTPVVVAEEAVKDEEGSSLNVGDVVKAGDGGIYQVIYSYSEGKPFLVPFDLKKRKVSNLRNRIYFDSDSMIAKRLHKVMSHSATKGGFIK